MNLLILGGTSFLGPALVESARAHGWTVTLFNRGKTNPGLFKDQGIEQIHGDRDPQVAPGLEPLAAAIRTGRTWDAVIDTSAYVPRITTASAELLKPAVRQYVLITTLNVYADPLPAHADESAPLAQDLPGGEEKVTNESYGPNKAACERALAAIYGDRATMLRPTLIVGPGDPTHRFTYWPARIQRGGEVLVADSTNPWDIEASIIDVRDLADFACTCAEKGHGGAFNCAGPNGPLTFDGLVMGCRAAFGNEITLVPVDEEWLLQQGVQPWMGLPMWIPGSMAAEATMGSIDRKKSIVAGMMFRPLAVTARDTADWLTKAHPGFDFGSDPVKPGENGPKRGAPGLSRAREEDLLAAWKARPKS